MSQKLNRGCWWCGKKLMAVSHAEVKTPDGRHTLWVHKVCVSDTKKYFTFPAAQIRGGSDATER